MIIENKKIALITGITGQDGSYLAELLLDKGYVVHGIIRRNSNEDYGKNISHIKDKIYLHYADLSDFINIRNIVEKVVPDEIYNLGAQSHVKISFELPEYTCNVNGFGVMKLLEVVKDIKEKTGKVIKFYQASTSEMFGKVWETPQKESTPFYPRSPYAAAKLFAHNMVINYREAYDIFACSGILFNHESPRRGNSFVTQKIVKGIHEIAHGRLKTLSLGNINSMRDWGHAKDYVEAMWLMLQQDVPKDYVISTGKTYTVKFFVEKVCKYYGINITWISEGINEIGLDSSNGNIIIKIDSDFFRPTEVDLLLGDSSLARKELNWNPSHDIDKLIKDMCDYVINEEIINYN